MEVCASQEECGEEEGAALALVVDGGLSLRASSTDCALANVVKQRLLARECTLQAAVCGRRCVLSAAADTGGRLEQLTVVPSNGPPVFFFKHSDVATFSIVLHGNSGRSLVLNKETDGVYNKVVLVLNDASSRRLLLSCLLNWCTELPGWEMRVAQSKQDENAPEVAQLRQSLWLAQEKLRAREDEVVNMKAEVSESKLRLDRMASQRKALKAQLETQTKEMARMVQVSGLESFAEFETVIDENKRLQLNLANRSAEKVDLVNENASLRAALECREKQDKDEVAENRKQKPPKPRRSFIDLKKAATMTALSTPQLESEMGSIKLKKTERKKLDQLSDLANSLMEKLKEKEEHLEEQRFANKKLADKIQQLEREASKWRR